ncbi:Di-sulfide bridge nucleocytoplasmic transport domain family protein [Babesia bovis T2Bo]|uniref:Brl1/Brr6 domain-containing protein n=1 Tax=Babesia bovis TaxID=5865 RepID=A7AQ75_BABBO|nr:Di-sulfide bridge nucleocytoplasmic transport domain family protein [Babesia bovis T2Bo]EDO08709.1 Di-sulfide bridge nucleocytoplasmic transport domain family protein [Babesia bovis T2Bo]|eukprot:XP_001612277.1 hypothetical protein [Babesia bovis T2Bo]
MGKTRYNKNPDVGDTLADLSALSIASNGKNPSRDDGYANGCRSPSGKAAEQDQSDDDILFVGTNIKVKVDKDEPMDSEYHIPQQPADDIHGNTHQDIDNEYINNEDIEQFNALHMSKKYENMNNNPTAKLYSGEDGERDNNGQASKISKNELQTPQTGFLLNFFRGKGAKATLRSIVKGKAVYNKVIDLDADGGTPCEFEDINDALDHIANTRSAHYKPPSVAGSVSNQSTESSRRRRELYPDYRHKYDYAPRRYSPGYGITGLGRIDPSQIALSNIKQNDNGDYRIMSPEIFNGWVRAFFNVAVTSVILYIGFVFIMAIGKDIANGLEKRRQMVKAEAMMCQELYKKNRCRTVNIPALEQQCREWETCMYKDAILYDDASFLSAEVLGGVINKFVSQLDARTVGIVVITFLAFFVGSNCALSMSSRPSNPGWFRRLFTRNRQPSDGSDVLPNGSILSQQQMLQAMQNPYLQPNYLIMGSYPYVSPSCYSGGYRPSAMTYYHDDHDGSGSWSTKHGRTSAWKRRFTSPWVDQE